MSNRAVFAILASLYLSACASIPLTSLPRLASLNPETLDFTQVALAVRMSEQFKVYRDGAVVEAIVESPSLDAPLELKLQMQPSDEPLTPYLRRQLKEGYSITVFTVPPEDKERIEAFRQQFDALRADSSTKGQNSTTISAITMGCHIPGPFERDNLGLTLYLRPAPDETFFKFIKETAFGADQTIEKFCTEEDKPRLF